VSELKIPALLLEGDADPLAQSTCTGPELITISEEPRVDLMARDPRSIYAHWEIPPAQQRQMSTAETSHPLILNVRRDNTGGPLAAQIRLASESDHAFVPVPEGGTKYVAELCVESGGTSVILATSAAVFTPEETISGDRSARYAQVPIPEIRSTPGLQGLTKGTAEEKLSGPEIVAPPRVSWIPILREAGESRLEAQVETPVTGEMIAALQNVFGDFPGFPFQHQDYRAYETMELEHLLRVTMSQLRAGDSSF
jgi:hypothetical protein